MNETDQAEFITEVSAAYTVIKDPNSLTHPFLFPSSVNLAKAGDARSVASIMISPLHPLFYGAPEELYKLLATLDKGKEKE
jgi:hypothetical protein